MLLEIIVICAVIVFLLVVADKARTGKHKTAQVQKEALRPGLDQSSPKTVVKPSLERATRTLKIDGTDKFPLKQAGFFRNFGIPVERLCDACSFKFRGRIESFPSEVALALQTLYTEGTAMGADIVSLIHHGRELKENEVLYFGLTQTGNESNDYEMYAFVDVSR